MSDGPVLISDSGSESSRSPPPPPLAEIIDLTQEDTNSESLPWSYIPIIDLTEEDSCSPTPAADCTVQDQVSASPTVHAFPPQLCFSTKQEVDASAGLSPAAPLHGFPTQPGAATDTIGRVKNESSFSPAPSHCSSSRSPEPSCSTSTYNSDSSSPGSTQLDQVLFSSSILDSSGSTRGTERTPPTFQLRELPPRLSPAPASIPESPGKDKGIFLEASGSQEASQQVTSARTKADSMVWLNKLRCFRRSGVQHLFLLSAASDRETPQQKTKLIPSSKMSMVRTTMEENFPEGTLHFLSDFTSCQHRPPSEVISYLIRRILLNSHQEEILQNTYTLLMKIQMLHPATTTTVGWDWTLLKYTMENQEKLPGRLLFLQYVVQTLEDDFQQNLRLCLLQKSITKKVLSCDTCFSNVKEVVEWLVAVVTGTRLFQLQEPTQEIMHLSAEAETEHSSSAAQPASTDQAELTPPTFFTQKAVLLLQRMLSFAVEVDRSPNCSSCKIADVIFPFILNIPVRSQREALLNTMESNLLRCKLLEMMFQHSCDVPTNLPLSLSKILYFLGHSSVLLQYQDEVATWQKWDELLQYLSLLLLSYHSVVAEHLRSSLTDRMDLIIQKAKPKLQDDDNISQLDIHLKIKDFLGRMQQVLEQPFPVQIKEKVHTLKQLFLVVIAT